MKKLTHLLPLLVTVLAGAWISGCQQQQPTDKVNAVSETPPATSETAQPTPPPENPPQTPSETLPNPSDPSLAVNKEAPEAVEDEAEGEAEAEEEPIEMHSDGDPLESHPIEKALRRELDRATSEGAVRAALGEARDAWYEEIKNVHKQILSRLKRPEEIKLFKKNIEAWNALSDSEDRLLSEILGSIPGSGSFTQHAELSYQIPKERIAKLHELISLLNRRDDELESLER